MKRLLIILLLLLTACGSPRIMATPNGNDIQLNGVYTDYTLTASGTEADPIVVWGNGSTLRCVLITGSYIIWRDTIVEGCPDHVIRVTGGAHVTIENNIIRNGVLDNWGNGKCNPNNVPGGWASGVKGSLGTSYLIVRNNWVYQICGEGIAFTRVAGGLIENNVVYDNYSVNIYVDNSFGVTVRNNWSYSTGNVAFYRSGFPAKGILLGVEDYGTAWGFQFHSNLFEGNTLERVGGIRYYAKLTGTPTNVIVRNNKFINVAAPVVSLPSWATVSNNVSVTPTASGATATYVLTSTPVINTLTPTRTTSPSAVPPTATATATPIPPTATAAEECIYFPIHDQWVCLK